MAEPVGIASLPFGWGRVTLEPEDGLEPWGGIRNKVVGPDEVRAEPTEGVTIYYEKVDQHWEEDTWKPEECGAPSYEAWLDATGFDDRTGMSPSPHGGPKFQKLLHFLLVASSGEKGQIGEIMDTAKAYKEDYVLAVVKELGRGDAGWPSELLGNPTNPNNVEFKRKVEEVTRRPMPAATSQNSVPVAGWKKGGPLLATTSMGQGLDWKCSHHVPFRSTDVRGKRAKDVPAWNHIKGHDNGHVNALTFVPWSKLAFVLAAGIASRGANGLKNQAGVNAVAESNKDGREHCYYMPGTEGNKMKTQPYPHTATPCIPVDMRLAMFLGLYYYPGWEASPSMPNPRYFKRGNRLVVQEQCNPDAAKALGSLLAIWPSAWLICRCWKGPQRVLLSTPTTEGVLMHTHGSVKPSPEPVERCHSSSRQLCTWIVTSDDLQRSWLPDVHA